MNRAQILGSMVSRKSATLGRGSSTSSDWKIYHKGRIGVSGAFSGIGPTHRTHLKSYVLVLLKNPSGGFEDLLYVFLSQLLEIRHSWLELFAHVAFVLAETECRLMGHTGDLDLQLVVGVRKRTVVTDLKPGHASSFRYTGISAPRISIETLGPR